MADAPASTTSSSKSGSLGFLGRKIGPVPIWLIGVALIAAYYWYSHYGPGATASTAATADQIDPVTGESYAEELGAAQQQIQDLQMQKPTGGGTGMTDTLPAPPSPPPKPVTTPAPKPKPKPKLAPKPKPKPKPKLPEPKPKNPVGHGPARPRVSARPTRNSPALNRTDVPDTRWRAAA